MSEWDKVYHSIDELYANTLENLKNIKTNSCLWRLEWKILDAIKDYYEEREEQDEKNDIS